MDNRIELSDWEMMFLEMFHVKVENGMMSNTAGSEIIEPCGVSMKPFVQKPGENNIDDNFMHQKVELYFEGYNRYITIRRYGNIPGPMSIKVGKENVYTVEEQNLPDGLKRVMVSRSFGNEESRVEIIPNVVLPNGEKAITVTKFSNVYKKGKEPVYPVYVVCTPSSIRLIDTRKDIYYNFRDSFSPKEYSYENYEKVVSDVILHNYYDYDYSQQELFFQQNGIPFLMHAFEAASIYYEKEISEEKSK